MTIELRPFQRAFNRAVESGRYDISALSLPRGNGKSYLAGRLLARTLTPGDSLFRAGTESFCVAASLGQARIVFRFALDRLPDGPDYRHINSNQRLEVLHKPTGTVLKAISSRGRTAFGLGQQNLIVGDEPGAWNPSEGALLWDALRTGLGKPGQSMRLVLIGTKAPALPGSWWPQLLAHPTDTTHVQMIDGQGGEWDAWPTIRRANPLAAVDARFRARLLAERDDARSDPALKAAFCSYRLNVPERDASKVLITVADWRRVRARPVPERVGQPVVGIDLGAGRSWSAAVGIWPNGRVEAMALAPGIPGIDAQEKRDRVGAGVYIRLLRSGRLLIDEGVHMQRVSVLWDAVKSWSPALVLCDRFRAKELQDVVGWECPVESRAAIWSQASADVRAARKLLKDGPLAVEKDSVAILETALSNAAVCNDQAGNTRLLKDDNGGARDDAAAALVTAAGAFERLLEAGEPGLQVSWA